MKTVPHPVRIGTRGSPLALAQTHAVRAALASAHGVAENLFEIVIIKTTGDLIQDRALSESGGKGLFTKELDVAMLEGRIDIAVHSSKDLPTFLPDGICLAGFTAREDVRDVMISAKARSILDLPQGARFGSASLRRQAQVLRLRPDLQVTLLRGNVETRLRKAETGEVDMTLLALAGLKRLGLAARATAVLDVDDFLPAVGQGAVGITARPDDEKTLQTLAPILDANTGHAVTLERAFLTRLDGSCRTPIAGHAQVVDGALQFRGQVLRADGSESYEVEMSGPLREAEALGTRAGDVILSRAPKDILGA